MAVSESASDGFLVLPIRMPPMPSFPKSAVHEIWVRRNRPQIPTPDDDRSLFLKNIPTDSTEPHFRAVFSALVGAGRFESIAFADEAPAVLSTDPAHTARLAAFAQKRKRADVDADEQKRQLEAAQLPRIWTRRLHVSSGTAVALFADAKSVQLVLKAMAKLAKTNKYPVWGEQLAESVPPLGAPWITSHLHLCRSDKAQVQSAVHAFFNVFNQREKEAAELAKKLRNEPDEDGFITVTRGGRAAPASRAEAEEARQRLMDRQAEKAADLDDFYRFQLRERKKRATDALVKAFKADQHKVKAMRANRAKFRPD